MLKLDVLIPPSCCLLLVKSSAGPESERFPQLLDLVQAGFPLRGLPVVGALRGPAPAPCKPSAGSILSCPKLTLPHRCRLFYSGWCPPRSLRLPIEDCACPFQVSPHGKGSHPQNKAIKGTEYFLFLSGLILGAAGKHLGTEEAAFF